MYVGKWITGAAGAKRLELMAQELDRKKLKQINDQTKGEWKRYSPWMSCEDNLDFFASNNFFCVHEATKTVFDLKSLQILTLGLVKDDAPFGSLRIFEKDGFYIDASLNESVRAQIEAAINVVINASPSFALRWNALIDMVIPIGFQGSPPSALGRGLSTHFFRKGIFLQPPESSPTAFLQLALNVAHELGHQALITYQNADLIIESDRKVQVFSVIRNIARPAIRSFHALVVCGYMLEVLIELKRGVNHDISQQQIQDALQNYRHLTLAGILEFRKSPIQFTQLGQEILQELELLSVHEGVQ